MIVSRRPNLLFSGLLRVEITVTLIIKVQVAENLAVVDVPDWATALVHRDLLDTRGVDGETYSFILLFRNRRDFIQLFITLSVALDETLQGQVLVAELLQVGQAMPDTVTKVPEVGVLVFVGRLI